VPGDIPICWVGLGSNLLVRDGGVEGMVLRTSKGLSSIRFLAPDRIVAEAGVHCAKVARTSIDHGLGGAEFLAGVPGSFGGALAMNAGAFGGETWDLVDQIECVNRKGECRIFHASEIRRGYRWVELPDQHWLLGGQLNLRSADDSDNTGRQRIRSLLEKRNASQPIQSANAGSVFRNPDGDYAARLLEESGLKGLQIGDAVVSETHANFIINRGKARAAEIEQLIILAQRKVREQTGIDLVTEVRIIGRQA
jgi:UDP-N-acetylmuramate dehydrogenase